MPPNLFSRYGVIIPKGISYIRKQIPLVLEDAENGLTALFRELLNELYETLYKKVAHLDKRIEKLEQKLETIAANNEACKLLLTIPGIGLLSATTLYAAIGVITAFKNGRETGVRAHRGRRPDEVGVSGFHQGQRH